MLLSVIIPFYENIDTIDGTLSSLREAILMTDIFFEIIFIDNNSNDGTAEKIKKFLSDFNFAKIIKETNQGVSYARNTGLLNSKGKYIAFIDADDFIYKDYFLKLKNKINSDYDIIIFSLNSKNNYGIECNDLAYIEKEFLLGWWNCQFIYKKILSNGLCFQGRCYEDVGYFPFILSLGKKIYVSGERIYFYRDNKKSITHSDQKWKENELILQYNFIILNKNKININLYRRVIRDILHLKFYLRACSCRFPASSMKEVLLFLYLAILRKETVKTIFSLFRIFLLLPRRAVKLYYLKK